MNGVERSLLAFLDAPVVVGDPEGNAVWVNPAFAMRFQVEQDDYVGRPLAELFEGGGREALLRAVAAVCSQEESTRFRVRDAGIGYAAVASPILAGDRSVGVVILLKEEVEGVEHLLEIHREIEDPLSELETCLQELHEQTGGRRSAQHRAAVEDGLRSLTRLRKWCDELSGILSGRGSDGANGSWDPAEVTRHVMRRIQQRGGGRTVLDLLAPQTLPRAHGDGAKMEAILLRLVGDRLEQQTPPEALTLAARSVGTGESASVLVSLTERFRNDGYLPTSKEAPLVGEVVAACGGSMVTASDPELGRTTLMSFPQAPTR